MSVKYNVIGLMSGTSMDGLDIVYCSFFEKENQWQYKVHLGDTIPYSLYWLEQLNGARELSEIKLLELDKEYGEYLGMATHEFIEKNKITEINFVASHGHTVHHEPHKGITVQIGSGKTMHKLLGIPVVNDFRTADVKMGGQGAPLVPIGDQLLFSEYDACLNLGGFSNISFEKNAERLAFDIGPANIVLNYIARLTGVVFDMNGDIAKSGIVDTELLCKLNAIPYYQKTLPKSLGIEWVDEFIMPLLESKKHADLLRTLTEHCTFQIARVLDGYLLRNVLVTGGGVYNSFFMECLKSKTKCMIITPEKEIVEYKEALIFAFLGVLKWENKVNILKSVTGASNNHSSGEIHHVI